MNKTRVLALAAFAVLIAGAAVLFLVIGSTTVPSSESEAKAPAATSAAPADGATAPAATATKAEAEKLIGESLSREEIEGILGPCQVFDMNSNGCERGVYAGEFYYEDFTIFSRTYDKGGTFRIVSVNE